jgi:hypothetical protein
MALTDTLSDLLSKGRVMPPQMNPFDIKPEHVFFFIALTLVFLLLAWLLHIRARPLGTSLIWWGILVIILSCGYAMIGVPSMVILTPALMKIGFLLVLGGVAWSLLPICPKQSASKESDYV